MPLPTTRIGRFRYRQARYRRRAARAYRSAWQHAYDGQYWRRVFRSTPLWHGPKQLPPGLRPSSYSADWHLPEGAADLYWVLGEALYRIPPTVTITAPWYFLRRQAGIHQSDQWIGYHRRRVFAWRNKPGRLSGWKRRVWFANVYYFRHGFYPLLDPLHRQPDEVTVWDDPSTAGPGGVMPDPFGM